MMITPLLLFKKCRRRGGLLIIYNDETETLLFTLFIIRAEGFAPQLEEVRTGEILIISLVY